MESLKTI